MDTVERGWAWHEAVESPRQPRHICKVEEIHRRRGKSGGWWGGAHVGKLIVQRLRLGVLPPFVAQQVGILGENVCVVSPVVILVP